MRTHERFSDLLTRNSTVTCNSPNLGDVNILTPLGPVRDSNSSFTHDETTLEIDFNDVKDVTPDRTLTPDAKNTSCNRILDDENLAPTDQIIPARIII